MLWLNQPVEKKMGLLRWVALGAAGAYAYKLLKQRQTGAAGTPPSAYDDGSLTPPHGDPLLDADAASLEPEPVISASQSSRGFGGT